MDAKIGLVRSRLTAEEDARADDETVDRFLRACKGDVSQVAQPPPPPPPLLPLVFELVDLIS